MVVLVSATASKVGPHLNNVSGTRHIFLERLAYFLPIVEQNIFSSS